VSWPAPSSPSVQDLTGKKIAAPDWGFNPAEHGPEPNRRAIRMMIQYCYEQGLIRTLYKPEELFAESCL